jgi:hypothetical protein
MRDTHRRISLEESRGIMERLAPSFVPVDEADEERCSADFFMQPLHHLNVLGNEAGLEEQILRRITGNGEFRHKNQVGPGGVQAFVGLQNFVGITPKITNRGVDLSKANFHASQADYALGLPEQRLLQA